MWKSTTYNTTKVTIELRDIVENGTDPFDFEYPSYYQGEQKKAFEKKVIDHYYFRQIGQETVGRFLHCFRTRVNEIMPRYLELYRTVEIMHGIEDPFGNVDVTETSETVTVGRSNSSQSSTGHSSDTVNKSENLEHKFASTPQGTIDNVDRFITEATKDNTVANGSNVSDSEGSSTSEGSNEDRTTHTHTKKGNQGVNTYAHDMIEFRQSIIDVDMMIINDLNDLFLGVY